LLICLYNNESGAEDPTWPGSYATNELVDEDTGLGNRIAASYIFATGNENASNFSVGTVSSNNKYASALLVHIAGAHASTPPEISTVKKISSDKTEAIASLNPTGWDVEDTLWLWFLCNDNRLDQATFAPLITTYPKDFTGNQTEEWGTATEACPIACATQTLAAASYGQIQSGNPDGEANKSRFDGHGEAIIAIRPAGAAPAGPDTPQGIHGLDKGFNPITATRLGGVLE
jgi:hypothetical protein